MAVHCMQPGGGPAKTTLTLPWTKGLRLMTLSLDTAHGCILLPHNLLLNILIGYQHLKTRFCMKVWISSSFENQTIWSYRVHISQGDIDWNEAAPWPTSLIPLPPGLWRHLGFQPLSYTGYPQGLALPGPSFTILPQPGMQAEKATEPMNQRLRIRDFPGDRGSPHCLISARERKWRETGSQPSSSTIL